MEIHPRLYRKEFLLQEQKIILGSFPVWSHTRSEPFRIVEEIEKEKNRLERGDIDFFFGSSKNKFWKWYRSFVDEKVQIDNPEDIRKSLATHRIGITDLIVQCKRKEKSSLDKHLTHRTYNHNFFCYPKKNETIKILCTSKGLMHDMLLNKSFFKLHPTLEIDFSSSEILQRNFFARLSNAEYSKIKSSFFYKIHCESGGYIECFAIPSPGSPYRKLNNFGFKGGDNREFLNEYLSVAFSWFS